MKNDPHLLSPCYCISYHEIYPQTLFLLFLSCYLFLFCLHYFTPPHRIVIVFMFSFHLVSRVWSDGEKKGSSHHVHLRVMGEGYKPSVYKGEKEDMCEKEWRKE